MKKSDKFYVYSMILLAMPLALDVLGISLNEGSVGIILLAGLIFLCTGNILEALNK